MSQAGYTPIQLYYSTTAAAVPVNTNLANGELAINITDGKLYYKDNGGTVRLLASNATSAPVLSFQTSLGGLTPSTATTGVVTLAGTLNTTSGGTGLTSYTAGDLSYYASGTALTKLAIGTAGQILTVNSGATAPQWSTLSGVAVTTFSAGTTGFTPSSATSGAVTLAGTLATTNGGTGLTSFTSGGVVYASSSSALATGSTLVTNGSSLGVGSSDFGGAGSINVSVGVAGTTTGGLQLWSTTTGQHYVQFGDGTSGAATYAGAIGYNHTSDRMDFYSAATLGMSLTSTGLGIGTSSPAYKLDVVGTGSIISATRADTNRADMIVTNNGGTVSFGINNAAGSWLSGGLGYYGYILGPSSASYGLQFGVGASNTAALTIAPAGNVGIGTSSPSTKLTVYDATAPQVTFNNGTSSFIVGNISGGNDHILYGTGAYPMVFYTNGTERARIDSSGNVGIGTSSPSSYGKFAVVGSTSQGSGFVAGGTNAFSLIYASSTSGTMYLGVNGTAAGTPIDIGGISDNASYFGSRTNTVTQLVSNNSVRATISAAGGFSVGTTADPGAGAIYATGNITAYYSSDIKFKENVRDIPDALATVNAIGGKLFDWKDDYIESKGGADGYFVQKADFGVVAQDVQKVFPIAVRTREDGSLAVDYEKLGALAFAALVELTKRVEALEAK